MRFVPPHEGWRFPLNAGFLPLPGCSELARIVNALGAFDGRPLEMMTKAALAVVDGVRPRVELDAMLPGQMAVVHALAMEPIGRAKKVDQINQFEFANNAANKLMRTFAVQIETLAGLPRAGEQKMTVGAPETGDVRRPCRGFYGIGTRREVRFSSAAQPGLLVNGHARRVRKVRFSCAWLATGLPRRSHVNETEQVRNWRLGAQRLVHHSKSGPCRRAPEQMTRRGAEMLAHLPGRRLTPASQSGTDNSGEGQRH